MVELTVQVEADLDDGERREGLDDFSPDRHEHQAGHHTSAQYLHFGSVAKFDNVTVPKDSVINSALLKVVALTSLAGANVKSTIDAEDADNVDAISSKEDWDGAVRTTASVNWDDIPAWTANVEYSSPDIKTVIQEIVDRGGWVNGNSINIFWSDFEGQRTAAGDLWRNAYSHDYNNTKAPKLFIDYSIPVSGAFLDIMIVSGLYSGLGFVLLMLQSPPQSPAPR